MGGLKMVNFWILIPSFAVYENVHHMHTYRDRTYKHTYYKRGVNIYIFLDFVLGQCNEQTKST